MERIIFFHVETRAISFQEELCYIPLWFVVLDISDLLGSGLANEDRQAGLSKSSKKSSKSALVTEELSSSARYLFIAYP
jgi:hypothetical protein